MECNICLSYYTTNKNPYTGSCGHSFCLECWVKASHSNYYICPLCKKVMHINSIVKNFLAIEILEKDSILTMSSLINEYKQFEEKFEEKFQQNKKLKENILQLKKEKRSIIEDFKKEAFDEIIENTYKKSNSIMLKTYQLTEKMISETEDIILDMLIGIENSVKKIKDKLDIYKNINIELD